MKKWILTGFVGLVLFSDAGAQQKKAANKAGEKTFELAGNIAGLTSPRIMLRYETGGKTLIDTAVVFNGSFVFRGTLDGPTFSQMMSTDFKFAHSQYLDNAKMTIVKKDSASDVVVSGSATEDENTAFNKYRSALGDKIYLLRQELDKLNETDPAAAEKRAKAELYPLFDSMNLRIESYVKEHPKSLISLIELSKIADGIDTKVLRDVFSGLDRSLQESSIGKGISASIDTRLKTAVGVAAIPFTQKNEKGEEISLSSFKGKYVLIDFWASWCGPCRAENPNVVKSYNQYKDKGFAILGISLDQDGEKWKTAIAKDSLQWAQVSDLKGWQNAVAVQYGIRGIPANFLIGPDGIIVAKDLRGPDLEKKLSEIFDK